MIPAPFTEALRQAMPRGRIPPNLAADLRGALHRYRTTRGAAADMRDARDAVRRVLTTVQRVEQATRRAERTFNRLAPTHNDSQTWTEYLPIAWREAAPVLSELRDRLEAWLASVAAPPRRRGAPHEGRFQLRLATFDALQRHGQPIRINGLHGVAARVLAAVLAEADRLDDKPAKDRASFNGTQWATWVEQYRQADALLLQGERQGFPRAYLIEYLILRT